MAVPAHRFDLRSSAFICGFFLFCSVALASEPIRLWDGDAPGALGKEPRDIPHLLFYPANSAKSTGAALLMCPGGGYYSLNQRSGTNFAVWFSENGVDSFVLTYRLGGKDTNDYRWSAPFDDATRAMRLIRARASEFKIDPKHLGIIGASAGGHLAAMMLVRFDSGKIRFD